MDKIRLAVGEGVLQTCGIFYLWRYEQKRPVKFGCIVVGQSGLKRRCGIRSGVSGRSAASWECYHGQGSSLFPYGTK